MHIYSISQEIFTLFLLCCALLCFVVVIHWLIFPYPSGLLHWHCGNLTIAPVPAKQPWWIWINTSCEFIMNDCITTTKQSTTKPCAYFLGYTVCPCALFAWPPQIYLIFWILFHLHGSTFIPASAYIRYKFWDEITYPFPNFNGATIGVWEWIVISSNSLLSVITNPC